MNLYCMLLAIINFSQNLLNNRVLYFNSILNSNWIFYETVGHMGRKSHTTHKKEI